MLARVLIFFRTDEQIHLLLQGFAGFNRRGGVGQRGFKSLAERLIRRAERPSGRARQFDGAGHYLCAGVSAWPSRRRIDCARRPKRRCWRRRETRCAARAWKAAQGLVVEIGRQSLMTLLAVVPHQSHCRAIVIRSHRGCGADDPFLRRQADARAAGVTPLDGGLHQIVGAGLKFLEEVQAVRQRFLRPDAGGGLRQE
jgi:hypothetical protein